MLRSARLTVALAFLAFLFAGSLSAGNASAQMMHFTLNVVVQTEDGADVPAGQVCVSGEVDPICQDIPEGTPSGREFEFDGLADGDHEVTVSAEPYLEAVSQVTLTEDVTTITVTLEFEQVVPTETAAPTEVAIPTEAAAPTATPSTAAGAGTTSLPSTGTGSTETTGSTTALLLVISGLLFGLFSLVLTRRQRTR